MKKRTLLVSTAILLVAIMALATASYAWFSAGTTATATGMKVTVTSGTYLEIAYNGGSGSITFGKSATAGMSKTPLSPASSADAEHFFALANTADLASGTSGALTTSPVAAGTLVAAVEDTHYIVKEFYLKNNGADAIPVKATVNLTVEAGSVADTIKNSLRVGLVIDQNGTKTTKIIPIANNTDLVANSATTLVAPTYTANGTTVITSLARSGNATSFAVATDAVVDIAIWFEGQDDNNTGDLAAKLKGCEIGVEVLFEKFE